MTQMEKLLHDHVELEHALSSLRSEVRGLKNIHEVGDLDLLYQGQLAVRAEAMADALARHVDEEESHLFPLMRERLREDLSVLERLEQEHVSLRGKANAVVQGLRTAHYPYEALVEDIEVLYKAVDAHSMEEATLFSTRMSELFPENYMGG